MPAGGARRQKEGNSSVMAWESRVSWQDARQNNVIDMTVTRGGWYCVEVEFLLRLRAFGRGAVRVVGITAARDAVKYFSQLSEGMYCAVLDKTPEFLRCKKQLEGSNSVQCRLHITADDGLEANCPPN